MSHGLQWLSLSSAMLVYSRQSTCHWAVYSLRFSRVAKCQRHWTYKCYSYPANNSRNDCRVQGQRSRYWLHNRERSLTVYKRTRGSALVSGFSLKCHAYKRWSPSRDVIADLLPGRIQGGSLHCYKMRIKNQAFEWYHITGKRQFLCATKVSKILNFFVITWVISSWVSLRRFPRSPNWLWWGNQFAIPLPPRRL